VKRNPLALLAPALMLGIVNAITLNMPTHLLTLAVTMACVPLLRIKAGQFLRTSWPLGVAAATLVLVNSLADPSPGIGWADLNTGLITAVRLLAIALPGLVAFMAIEPVSLVDALVQYLHLPPRFGYGGLAAMRLLPTLADDLHLRRMALRARGATPTGIVGRIGSTHTLLVGLLVTAIRRATRLATALDARGFDTLRRATARPSRWTGIDTTWCASGVIIALAIGSIPLITS